MPKIQHMKKMDVIIQWEIYRKNVIKKLEKYIIDSPKKLNIKLRYNVPFSDQNIEKMVTVFERTL